jgi:hypothetical protein
MKLEIFGQNEGKSDTCILRLIIEYGEVTIRSVTSEGDKRSAGNIVYLRTNGELHKYFSVDYSLDFRRDGDGSVLMED